MKMFRLGILSSFCKLHQYYAKIYFPYQHILYNTSTRISAPTLFYCTKESIEPYDEHKSPTISFPVHKYPKPPDGKLNLVKNGQTSSIKPEDLYQELRYLRGWDALETFAANYAGMDRIHDALVLRRLDALRNILRPDLEQQYVQGVFIDERFQVLVAMITRRGAHQTADIQYHILHQLLAFGFPDNHPSVVVFLHLIQKNIDKLALDQLLHLQQLVKELDNTAVKGLILECIQALVPTRLPELKILDHVEATLFLESFSDKLNEAQRDFLLYKIDAELRNGSWIEDYHAEKLFWIFSGDPDLRRFLPDANLVHKILKVCHINKSLFDLEQLKRILRGLIQMIYVKKKDVKYCYMIDDFTEVLAENIKYGATHTALPILQMLSKISHFNNDLFTACENSLDLEMVDTIDLLDFLVCCWSMGYKFKDDEKYTECINTLISKLWNDSDEINLDRYLSLCLLMATNSLPIPASSGPRLLPPSDCIHGNQPANVIADEVEEVGECGTPIYDEESVVSEPNVPYLDQLSTWNCSLPYMEIVMLLKHIWKDLPSELSNLKFKEVPKLNNEGSQLYSYLKEAASSNYNLENRDVTESGILLDWVLTPENDISNKIAVVNFRRRGRISLENKSGLKQLVEIKLRCLHNDGYNTIAMNTSVSWNLGMWLSIPHTERVSRLQDAMEELISTDNHIYICL